MLAIGLMSGTSMDGIDAALLETDGAALINELGHYSLVYDRRTKVLLKAAEYAVRKYRGNLPEAHQHFQSALNEYLHEQLQTTMPQLHDVSLADVIAESTQLHIHAVNHLLKTTNKKIDVIGYHGQTLLHSPATKMTIQVGDGQRMANAVGITVINDFRSRDVAAGGQGAPFAPIYHQALAARDKKIPLAVVNCGGIANITLINSDNENELIGFDTGPGNALIDSFIRRHSNGLLSMDKDGVYGKLGKVNDGVLNQLYASAVHQQGKNFFHLPPPKSLDYGDMLLIPELATLSFADACRTLEAFTADSIVKSLELVATTIPKQWILAGGGWHNPVILDELTQRLMRKCPEVIIQTADEAGWNNTALEAQIFAYLAVRSLQGKPISLPGTTCVPQPLTGGCVYMPVGDELPQSIPSPKPSP